MTDQPEIVFDEHLCVCPDAPSLHDDGFGCTVEGCDCLAGWSFAPAAEPEAGG
jgi:hypothetical protein